MSDSNGFSGGQVMLAFVGGAVAGAVVALLTAPQSGAKTRADIRHRAVNTYDEAARMPRALQGAVVAAKDAFDEHLSASLAGNGA
jgi:gas vesicle protein